MKITTFSVTLYSLVIIDWDECQLQKFIIKLKFRSRFNTIAQASMDVIKKLDLLLRRVLEANCANDKLTS